MIKAVLFDLDGVLLDAVGWHQEAFIRAVKQVAGYDITEEFHMEHLNGLPTKTKLAWLAKQKLVEAKHSKDIYRVKQSKTIEIIKEANGDVFDQYGNLKMTKNLLRDTEKRAMMEMLHADGIKTACVTNSINDSTYKMLDYADLYSKLDHIVTNEDVRHPKPHPEGYWNAMTHFGVLPSETLIIEDSPKGVAAAKATGAHVWVVEGPHQVIWKNLAEVLKDAGTNPDGRTG
jgi:HAD superfamily hydrolase (TIGR01509 family)